MYYYLNQTNYPHVSYPTLTDLPEWTRTDSTVRSAGCGLCSASMVLTNLTGREFSIVWSFPWRSMPITVPERIWIAWRLMWLSALIWSW